MLRHDRRLARRALALGLLWGAAMTANEALTVPLNPEGSLSGLEAFIPLGIIWTCLGIPVAWMALQLEPWVDRYWKGVLIIGVMAVAAGTLNETLWFAMHLIGFSFRWEADAGNTIYASLGLDRILYVTWAALFHGSMFMLACIFLNRSERTERLLAQAQIARDRTEAIRDQAQFEALREQVDPQFLLRVMAEIGRRYRRQSPTAERLLDQLVAFLRMAMPGVRSGASSLAVEIALAKSCADLMIAIEDDTASAWQVQVTGRLPKLPFPPLLLIPLMDALASPDRPATLSICARNDQVIFEFSEPSQASGQPMPPALRYRTQVALVTLFGDAVRILVRSRPGDAIARITIDAAIEHARPTELTGETHDE